MQFLNGIKHVIPLSEASSNYVKKYQSNLQKVIKEAIKWDSDRVITSAENKSKRIGQLINEGTCTSQNTNNNNITITIGSKITSDPQQTAVKFNAFFIDKICDLKHKNNPINTKDSLHDHMTCNQNSMFVSPITANRVKCVINRLKGSLSAGFDDVPQVIANCCVQFITIPLVHILSLSNWLFS